MTGREKALCATVQAARAIRDGLPSSSLAVDAAQWDQCLKDADVTGALDAYDVARARVVDRIDVDDSLVGTRLREAANALVDQAVETLGKLDLLASLAPAREQGDAVAALARTVGSDVRAIIDAAVAKATAPPPPSWPTVPSAEADGRDVLLDVLGVVGEKLHDAHGHFSDVRVLAAYRKRLDGLDERCRDVMSLVADDPPSVFTSIARVRDIASSASPYLTVAAARVVRAMFLDAFDRDPDRATAIVAASWEERDQQWHSFDRLRAALGRAAAGATHRERAVARLEAYKHMAEGLTRRWAWTLLQLHGMAGDPPTVGDLPQKVLRLGWIGERVAPALIAAARNAEAHETFEYDDDAGVLRLADMVVTDDDLDAWLTELDVLQRGWEAGRASALADSAELAEAAWSRVVKDSRTFRLEQAQQRFGHAGMHVRSFTRDRDRVDVELDVLPPHACNPCFVALVQSSAILGQVSQFVVRIAGRERPALELPSTVLRANLPVFAAAASCFPRSLPQSTFIPCLTYARLQVEEVEQAASAAAYLVLNDAQHAINDAKDMLIATATVVDRLRVAEFAGQATLGVLEPGPHLKPLVQAVRIVGGTADGLADGATGVSADVLIDRVWRVRQRLGAPPAILPTVDPSAMSEIDDPHHTS